MTTNFEKWTWTCAYTKKKVSAGGCHFHFYLDNLLFSLFYYTIENTYFPSHNLVDKGKSQDIFVWISWPGGTEVQSSSLWKHALFFDKI